jgi:hypothetical protein
MLGATNDLPTSINVFGTATYAKPCVDADGKQGHQEYDRDFHRKAEAKPQESTTAPAQPAALRSRP